MPNHADPEGRPARALLVFLDGVGIGPDDAAVNPFAAAELPALAELLGGRRMVDAAIGDGVESARAVLVPADATLGVEGTPQSGTGQTSLLTGLNAAERYGRHFGPWVPTGLREMLAAENLLVRAARAGGRVAFANAYPVNGKDADPRIFRRPAAPPLAALSASALTRALPELAAGDAVASSITNERWRERIGEELPQITAAEGGRRLARIAGLAEVTLFAHYDTDYTGHRGGMDGGIAALEKVDAFLGALIESISPDTLLVVSSDHGNLEDVRGGHTRNPVPMLATGPGRRHMAERVRSIADVTPALLELLNLQSTT
jgi:2,3-bisphosphoglycerate-independent phosphoglycerate mutase